MYRVAVTLLKIHHFIILIAFQDKVSNSLPFNLVKEAWRHGVTLGIVKIDWICPCLTDFCHTYLFNTVIFHALNAAQHLPTVAFFNYLKYLQEFMSSFSTLQHVDMPPTLFPVCLGLTSASHKFSTYYSIINTSAQQSEKYETVTLILVFGLIK